MNEITVTIPISHYAELVRKAERIEALVRMYERTPYMTDQEIKAVLNINTEKETANETV